MRTSLRVDRNTLKTNQVFVLALTIGAFVLGAGYGRWVLLFAGTVMALGTVHPAFALFKQVHTRVLRPLDVLGADVQAEDPAPHQFAQALGAVFLLAAFAALVTGFTAIGWVLTWIVATLAFINLTVRFCAGCFLYYQLERFGLLPRSIASSRRT